MSSVLSARGAVGRSVLTAVVMLAATAAALIVLVRVQGTHRDVPSSVVFQERGVFDYSAVLGQNTYDGNELRIPGPFFRRLGETLPVTYRYVVSAPPNVPLEGLHGEYTVYAELRQTNGWSRLLPLAAPTPFEGTSFEAVGVIDVRTLGDLIRKLEAETGFKTNLFYVRVTAQVSIEGRVDGTPFGRSHQQALNFAMSEFELRLDREASKVDEAAPVEITRTVAEMRALSVPLLGLSLTYEQVSGLATYVLGGSGLAMMLIALATYLDPPATAGLGLPARLERRVTDVGGVDGGGSSGARVDVSDLESLFSLAEQYQLPVLRTREGARTTYWLLAETTYVFNDRVFDEAVHGVSGPAPPASHWPSIRTVPPSPDTSRPITHPSSPQRRGGLSASPRHSWTAMAAYSEVEADAPGSLGFGVARGRPSIDGATGDQGAAGRGDGSGPRVGRSYWGDVWPQYDEGGGKEDAA